MKTGDKYLYHCPCQCAGVATTPVAFNTRSLFSQRASGPIHLRFANVLYNKGDAFNSTTAEFTAPVSGIYVLYFHTRSNYDNRAHSRIKVQGRVVCTAFIENKYDHGSCQAAVHMAAGDRAWVEPYGSNMWYTARTTSFTGFLLFDDPVTPSP